MNTTGIDRRCVDSLRRTESVALLALLLLWAAGAVLAVENATRTTVRPADTGAPLINPGMGWVFHHYDNSIHGYGPALGPGYDGREFPGLSVAYLRLAWSYLEPEEGVFNWSVVDTVAQRYIAAGRRGAFRFTCFESSIPFATPEWVKDAGARGYWWQYGEGPVEGPESHPKACWEPDYEDPVFLAKLDRFLAAAAERYDGNPSVAFIDIGSIGIWGEGNPVSRRYALDMYRTHIDLHVRHFKETLLVGMDDWRTREERLAAGMTGELAAGFVLRFPEGYEGTPLDVKAGLWIPGGRGQHLPDNRLLPRRGEGDRRVSLGTVRLSTAGQPVFDPTDEQPSARENADFALSADGLARRGDGRILKVTWRLLKPLPEGAQPFCHLDAGDGKPPLGCGTASLQRRALDYARELGATMRDDSIIYREGVTFSSDWLARDFWPDRPVVIESGHYSANNWGDKSDYFRAIEAYHASYVSIHGDPRVIWSDHADIIPRMNQRIGYRLQLAEASWPDRVYSDEAFVIRASWRNAGVAPCYGGGHPIWTLKNDREQIVGVFVDDTLNVRDLPTAAPGKAIAVASAHPFRMPPKITSGRYRLWISVGDRDGTPRLALPLADGDGSRRYRIGEISVRVRGEYRLHADTIVRQGDQWVLPVTFEVLEALPADVTPFCHLDKNGKIVAGLGCRLADGVSKEALRTPGKHRAAYVLSIPEGLRDATYDIKAGLWVFRGRRIIPENGEADLRVHLGVVRAALDGTCEQLEEQP